MLVRAIYEGILLGLTLAFLIGPSFFAIIQTSTVYGLRSGVFMAIGIVVSDLAYVALAYFGASQFFDEPSNKVLVALAGGVILIMFGTYTFFNKGVPKEPQGALGENNSMQLKGSLIIAVVKGFFLNALNPSVFIFWVGWVGLISPRFEFSKFHIVVFFGAALATIFATDCLKALGANKLREVLKPKVLLVMNKIIGIILAGVGIYLILRAILQQTGML